MDLKSYLRSIRISFTELAQFLECDRSYLSRIAHGHVIPGKRLAKDIERFSKGAVRFDIMK